MQASPTITLTTDFGYDDPFAGVMKGVILTINPAATIVDITHGIRPHDIREAAYAIGMNYNFFPSNTIHVVVVDPGVGSGRRPLLVSAGHHYFIGPDNGVFSHIYRMHHDSMQVSHINAVHYFLSSPGATFQGRNVFAPVAAWFSRGIAMSKFGDPVTDFLTIPIPVPELSEDGSLRGEVVHVDRFGNAITNISEAEIAGSLKAAAAAGLRISVGGNTAGLKDFYEQGNDGRLHALVNSSGSLEFFVYQGSAAARFHIAAGDPVEVIAG